MEKPGHLRERLKARIRAIVGYGPLHDLRMASDGLT